MIAWLASLRLTLVALAALVIWLWLGSALAGSPDLSASFKSLNQQPLLSWLADAAVDNTLVAGWLIGFLLLGGLLGINLVFCTLVRLTKGGNVNLWRKRLVLVLHLLMLVVMLAHGASFVMGTKRSGIRMTPGQSLDLPGGLQVRLQSVVYGSDRAILALDHKQSRRLMTRSAFSRHQNYAEVSVYKNGKQLGGDRIYYFQPMNVDGVGLHLTGFFVAKKSGGQQVGIKLNVVHSPLWPLFSSAYAAVIVALLWLTLLAVKPNRRNR